VVLCAIGLNELNLQAVAPHHTIYFHTEVYKKGRNNVYETNNGPASITKTRFMNSENYQNC